MLSSIEFIPFKTDNGISNMALDKSMAEKTALDNKTYIRFYTWQPFCISLGHSQDDSQFDTLKLSKDKIDLVRRPTGGRAVFHSEELTYCISTPTAGSQHNREVYKYIHETISKGLLELDVETDFAKHNSDLQSHYKSDLAKSCFTSSARYELTIDGNKLVGSAQRDYGGVLLQHGSILLGPKHFDIVDYINFGDDSEETEEKKLRFSKVLRESSTDVYSATGNKILPELLSDTILKHLNI